MVHLLRSNITHKNFKNCNSLVSKQWVIRQLSETIKTTKINIFLNNSKQNAAFHYFAKFIKKAELSSVLIKTSTIFSTI